MRSTPSWVDTMPHANTQLITQVMTQAIVNATAPLLAIENLRVDFRVGKNQLFHAVNGVSFEIPANRTVAVVGESGSGKSVTAMAILRLLPDNAIVSGAIRFEFVWPPWVAGATRAESLQRPCPAA